MTSHNLKKFRMFRSHPDFQCFLVLLPITILTFIFFFEVHPLVPFDTDDWTYLGYYREAFPLWGNWNPTRVFPEVLIPNMAYLASFVFQPILNNWLKAIILSNALVATGAIVLYIAAFYKLIKEKTTCSSFSAGCLTILFWVTHFILLYVDTSNNYYFFYTGNMTCFYYYVVSNLLCATLVMYAILCGSFTQALCNPTKSMLSKAILLLAIYLALFSNLFASVILGAFVGLKILFAAIQAIKKGGNSVCQLFKAQGFEIVILALWLIANLFEINGGRADSLNNDSFLVSFRSTLEILFSIGFSKKILALLVFPVFALIVYCVIEHQKSRPTQKNISLPIVSTLFLLALCGLLTTAYLLIVCAKAGPSYIGRPDVIFGSFFYLFLICFIAAALLLSKLSRVNLLLPIMILILANYMFSIGPFLKNSNAIDVPAKTAENVTQDIINQLVLADRSGLEAAEIHVPKFDSSDNWPIANYAAPRINITATKSGLISKPLELYMVIDEQKNNELPN